LRKKPTITVNMLKSKARRSRLKAERLSAEKSEAASLGISIDELRRRKRSEVASIIRRTEQEGSEIVNHRRYDQGRRWF